MELKPLKYKQPVIGDARCALYSMANLFDDRAFLLMNNVNEMTDHEQELHYLSLWAMAKEEAGEAQLVNYLDFHAGIFGHGRLHLEDLNVESTGNPEVYFAGLLDYRIPGRDYAHTVGFLWPEGERFIVIDAQKNEPKQYPKEAYFKTLEVVGFRLFKNMLEGGQTSFFPIYFTAEAFPHIFHTTGQEALNVLKALYKH